MASTYLNQKEAEYRILAQQEKNEISSQINSQIYDVQKKHKEPQSMSDSIPIGCLGSVVLVVVITAVSCTFNGKFFLYGLIGTIVFTVLAHYMNSNSTSSHNSRLDREINGLRQQEAAQHREIDEKYARRLEQETDRFKASVKASRTKYGGRTTSQPLIKWLCTRFENEIIKADRRPHNINIEYVFAFRVDADQLATLKKVNNSDQYGNAELFDFNINRFCNLPDFEDRVGFSQAMAKLVQFEIMRRFPRDPVAPSSAKPIVVITSDDTLMELRYQVANPNYRRAVTL